MERRMKLIIAIIGSENFDAVQTALDRQVSCLVSVSQMYGYGPEPNTMGSFRGSRFRVRRSKLRLEIAIDDEYVEAAVQAIQSVAAQTNQRNWRLCVCPWARVI